MNYTDKYYLSQISPYLENFQDKAGNVWQCRCPYCNDSAKNKRKARGYFYVAKDQHIVFACHNCTVGDGAVSLSTLLKDKFPQLHTQYRLDSMRSNASQKLDFGAKKETKVDVFASSIDKIKHRLIKSKDIYQKISDLSPDHFARKHMEDRGIKDLDRFGFTFDFCRYVAEKTNNDERYARLAKEPRIIIPLLNPDGEEMGFQGRILNKNDGGVKYITIRTEPQFVKIYGLERYQKNKPGFIVEGPFDSYFLPNGLAMCGASLDFGAIDAGFIIPENTIVILDNEPRNKQIVHRMYSLVDAGFRVYIPPKSLDTKVCKDINLMVLAGWTQRNLVELFVKNSATGNKAKLSINNWKKV